MDKNKIIITLATKQNTPNLTKFMLDYADAITRIDAVATPAYFYGCFGDLKNEGKIIKPYKFGPCKGISKGVLNAKNARKKPQDTLRHPNMPIFLTKKTN